MPSPLYFAWVGGPPEPPVEVLTTGDVWGGQVSVLGNLWGGQLTAVGDIVDGRLTLNGGPQITLRAGEPYTVTRAGAPPSSIIYTPPEISIDGPPGIAVSLTFTNNSDRRRVILGNIDQLEADQVYAISGSGIPTGAVFTFEGQSEIWLSAPATASAVTPLFITRPEGRNLVRNLSGDLLAALEEGIPYEVFGQGIPEAATGFWDGATTLILSAGAMLSGIGVTIIISRREYYPDGGAFNPAEHARLDEEIISLVLTHNEGDFAVLTITVDNPGIGLLASGRSRWAWLSWQDGAEVVPLFHGRLIGAPQAMQGETITLKLRARPENFEAQKAALAATMRNLPWFDRIWFSDNADEPDSVLTARPEVWFIDRTSLTVATSNIVAGEAGTVTIGEDDHAYDRFSVACNTPPLTREDVTAQVNWTQAAEGEIDLTEEVWEAFRNVSESALSALQSEVSIPFPIIATFTGDGFKSQWPAAGAEIGGGWSVGVNASLIDAIWIKSGRYAARYQSVTPAAQPTQDELSTGPDSVRTYDDIRFPTPVERVFGGYDTYSVLFELTPLAINLPLHYSAARERSEILRFSLEADIQSVLTDASASEAISFSSDLVAQPIDPLGEMPIGDLRRNAYFATDRGLKSLEFLLLRSAAKLTARARAIEVKFVTSWAIAARLDPRWNIELFARRLPGGRVAGKLTGLVLSLSGAGEMSAEVTIGCLVGRARPIDMTNGMPVWADDYVDDYQQEIGGWVELLPDALAYQNIKDIAFIDDDGVDLFNPRSLSSVLVSGGIMEQKAAIESAANLFLPGPGPRISINLDTLLPLDWTPMTPVEALAQCPTRLDISMRPVSGGPFQSTFRVLTSKLSLAKMIDLEDPDA